MTASPVLAPRTHRALASPVDAARWGEHRPTTAVPAAFAERITEPAAGRYHLYGAHACPASHRLAILRQLAGLDGVMSMSYVDGLRDARGWAFREPTGHDPVNGFTLLAQAYRATRPGYRGPATVPVLWDRATGSIVSNSAAGIGIDLATAFGDDSLRPARLAPAVDAMSQRVAIGVERHLGCAIYRRESASALLGSLREFDALLAGRPYLLGDRLTDADVRLWVQLVRYDAGANAIGPRLDEFAHLWGWARALYRRPAFASTTDFSRFAAPLADLPPWPSTA